MRITNIDFPEQLVYAHRQGKLVVFAGAGVSIEQPSGLPDFATLALQVSGDPKFKLSENEPIDHFLGQLETSGVDVHARARDVIRRSDSKPNPIHSTLLSLFPSSETVRLVTTNFDEHFSTAAKQLFKSPTETFYAPALPLGHKFNGIVYLHGCINHPCENLVITDSDFGRAYLTDGWARRFLQTMFAEFTVLFVGYSHSDMVINYLSRALLPSYGHRYAMTDRKDLERWSYLGIQGISYHCPAPNDHTAVVRAFETWVNLAKMGSLDHERRIRELVEVPPPLDQEAQDYLKDSLREVSNVRFFVQHATTPVWLSWVEQNSQDFVRLFDPSHTGNDQLSQTWASWFSFNFVWSNSEEGLAFLQRRKLRMSRLLWYSIATRLWINHEKAPDSTRYGKWVSVLLESVPLGEYESLGYLLKSCHHPDDKRVAALLFMHLTNPSLKLEPHYKFSEKDQEIVDADVSVQEEHYWLNESWTTYFKPNLGDYATTLAPIVENQLRMAHYLLFNFGKANQDFDPLTIRRPAIEPHQQNDHSGHNLVIIDAARDILEYLIVNNPEHASGLIKSWGESYIPILERLAVHGMVKNSLGPDEKIHWLLQRGWLFKWTLKHEVFCLLKASYPWASEPTRREMLKEILKGPGPEHKIEEDTATYMKYNILAWLNQADPDCALVLRHLNEIQKANPDFQPREHPDSDFWMSAGFRGSSSPLSVDELLATDPSEAIDFLLCYDGDHFNEPDREGLLEVVGKSVSRSFEWSLKLVQALKSVDPVEIGLDLWKQVARGWEEASLTEQEFVQIVDFFREFTLLDQLTPEIIDLINHKVTDDQIKWSTSTLVLIDRVTQILWQKLPQQEPDSPVDDWLGFAINHPAGRLTEIWLHLLSRRIREAQNQETDIFSDFQERFETILSADNLSGRLGRVILTSRLHFLHSLKPHWTEEKVFVLFDWSKDSSRAKQAWSGFLVWGKWSPNMLPNLLPLYRMTFNDFENKLTSELRKDFCRHLASIALFGVPDPIREGWLWEFLRTIDSDSRKIWASAIGSQLDSVEEETAKNIWNRWLREYWASRNTGVPVPLTSDELEEMIGWCTRFALVFDEVVEKICANAAPSLHNTRLYYDLKNEKLIQVHPNAMIKLLLHMLAKAATPFWQCEDAVVILKGLAKTSAPRTELVKICDELARLGCGGSDLMRDLETN